MNDAMAVRLIQRIGDLHAELQSLFERQRTLSRRFASVSPSTHPITRLSIPS
jgi:hypothetical protein